MKSTEVKDNPGAWKTFKGKSVTGDTIDHQHLSNVYWFGLILCNTEHLWALDILRERFNGQLLPIVPTWSSPWRSGIFMQRDFSNGSHSALETWYRRERSFGTVRKWERLSNH